MKKGDLFIIETGGSCKCPNCGCFDVDSSGVDMYLYSCGFSVKFLYQHSNEWVYKILEVCKKEIIVESLTVLEVK